jgi:tetratricopeptide (TPR) repeat protein
MNTAVASGRDALRRALAETAALLETQPACARIQAEALLRQAPGLAPAELLLCQALRREGQGARALPRLAALARREPRVPPVIWELAQCAHEAGASAQAIAALETLVQLQPAVAAGWWMLAAELRRAGQQEQAWRADLSAVHAAARDPELLRAAMAMNAGELDAAEAIVAPRDDDPAAIRLHGEIRWRAGELHQAIALVERALALAPGFDLAREFVIRLLLQANLLPDALAHAETLARSPVAGPSQDILLASVLVRLGEQERARGLYEKVLADQPGNAQIWQNLGHVLKTLGHQAEAVHAYRQAVRHQPTMGEAWWSMANLKTVRFDADDVAAMRGALGQATGDEDVFHLHFALGKALEDARDAAGAFDHYDQGNRLRRTLIRYDGDAFAAEVAATARAFTVPFGEGGCAAPDPIFVVGLPRSGSTLVEQILASHSHIEGTMELPEMMMIGARLQTRVEAGEFADLGAAFAALTPDDRLRLGQDYIDRTRVHRHTDRPLFVDKMPNNWQHVGLIRLILPNARIIDARRHPLSCCFSGWKQHFARGQAFTYDLGEIGRYYRDYVGLMAAWDRAAPGAVHRVIYERMVADTEGEVRRLLDYLGLPFEPACLEFYNTERAVRTASSEQVRRPIYRDAVEQWKAYDAWLDPLREALGDVATSYPDVPASLCCG